jgi:hypothetical protein
MTVLDLKTTTTGPVISTRMLDAAPAGASRIVSVSVRGRATIVAFRSPGAGDVVVTMAGTPDRRGAASVLAMLDQVDGVWIVRGPKHVDCAVRGTSRGRAATIPVSFSEALAVCATGTEGTFVQYDLLPRH